MSGNNLIGDSGTESQGEIRWRFPRVWSGIWDPTELCESETVRLHMYHSALPWKRVRFFPGNAFLEVGLMNISYVAPAAGPRPCSDSVLNNLSLTLWK
jgi:hypothetical protein